MSENPLLDALVSSAASGDTYSAWTSFKAFLTRRLRAPTLAKNATATYSQLVTAMESAAAPTLDSQMAVDLADAFLEIYRRSNDASSLRSDLMGTFLTRFRTAFAEAVTVDDTRGATVPTAVIQVSPSVVATSRSPSSHTANPSSHPTSDALEDRVVSWLEARSTFAHNVLVALLGECHGDRPAAPCEAAPVSDWIACREREEADRPKLFEEWVDEVSTVRAKIALVRALSWRRQAPDAEAKDRWQALCDAVNAAICWSVHTYSTSATKAEATVGLVVSFILAGLGDTGATADSGSPVTVPSTGDVRTARTEWLTKLMYDRVFRQLCSAPGAGHSDPDSDKAIAITHSAVLWRVFPAQARAVRSVCLPICARTLAESACLRNESSADATQATGDSAVDLTYVRFLVAATLLVQHTANPPREVRLQAAFDKVVRAPCDTFAPLLAQMPQTPWKATLAQL